MSMNPVIGKETYVEIGGEKYKLARFDRRIYDQFLQWADKQLGHPLDAIKDKLASFPPKIQEIMVRDALDRAALRRSISSPEVQALLATPEGCMKLLALLFQKHHPELTDRDVENLYEKAVEEHGPNYIENKLGEAQGVTPKAETEREKAALVAVGALKPDSEKKG
jgi:hypothetical protein